jgi:hypothetical protein
MAYFSHAFKKVFVSLGGGANTTVPTAQMSAGMFGFFDAKTWAPVAVAGATISAHPQVVFAMANPYHSVGADKQGVHGGFTESVKSQIIEPRNINRFWKIKPRNGRPHVVILGWGGGDDYSLSPTFFCGQTYWLRLDLKGSAALRSLGHNAYRYYCVTTPCCSDPLHPVQLDPVPVMFEFAKQIREDPLVGPLVSASVLTMDSDDWVTPVTADPDSYVPWTDPLDIVWVVTGLQLAAIPSDTVFNPLSFDLTDHYFSEPLMISSGQWINDKGVRCPNLKPLNFIELLSPLAPQGTPDGILRDLLSFIAYREEVFTKNARLRAVKDLEKIVADIFLHSKYFSYYILHSVPRRNNPSDVHDQDQYLLQIVFADGDSASMTFLENWMASYLSSAGKGVVMEDLSGEMDGT